MLTKKKTNRPGKRVLMRCDGAPEIGLGHVVRCLALADELRDQYCCEVAFAMLEGIVAVEQIQEHGYVVHQSNGGVCKKIDEGTWLHQLVMDTETDALILDVRTNLTLDAVQKIRANNVLIVTIDDSSERRLAADLVFYPPVPQVKKLGFSGFAGQLFVGWDWVLLRPEFALHRMKVPPISSILNVKNGQPEPLKVLVTMGTSDPACLTVLALKALHQIDQNLHVIVVLGREFMHESALRQWMNKVRRNYDFRRDVDDMPSLMAEAHIAIASFGVTAYEIAVIGVPAIYLCLTDDHALSARAFCDANIASSLGCYKSVKPLDIENAVMELLQDGRKRSRMSCNARLIIDGKGVKRVASKINSKIS